MNKKLVAIILAVVMIISLSGCARMLSKAIEKATGIGIDVDSGEVTIKGEDGSSTLKFSDDVTTYKDSQGNDVISAYDNKLEWPKDIPKDVPVIPGKFQMISTNLQTNNFSFTSTDITRKTVDDFIKNLVDKQGYEKSYEVTSGDYYSATLTGSKYSLFISIDDTWLMYVVAPVE